MTILIFGFLGWMGITWIGENQTSILETSRYIFYFWLLPFIGLCLLVFCWVLGDRTLEGTLRCAVALTIYLVGSWFPLTLGMAALLAETSGRIPIGIAPYVAGVVALPIALILHLNVVSHFGRYARARDLFLFGRRRAKRIAFNCGRELIHDRNGKRLSVEDWKLPFVQDFFYLLNFTKVLAMKPNMKTEDVDDAASSNVADLMRLCGAEQLFGVEFPESHRGKVLGHLISQHYFNPRLLSHFPPQGRIKREITEPSDETFKAFDEAPSNKGLWSHTRAFRNRLKEVFWYQQLDRARAERKPAQSMS